MTKHMIPLLGALALLAGCGGGGGGGGGGNPSLTSGSLAGVIPVTSQSVGPARNVLPISVNSGPANTVNLAFTSVTVCAPGSSSDCQVVDGIMVDTGSTGLRILSSVLAGLSLPTQTDASGNAVAECAQFAFGFSWGPVKIADVMIAGEQANALPIQVIGDPAFSSVPSSCSSTGPSRDTPQALSANGILGIGAFRHDCGNACAQSSIPGRYFACPSSGCRPTVQALAGQVANPVSMFASDNNGVLVQLPAIDPSGSSSLEGALIFGIGTQDNNSLGRAAVFTLDRSTGYMTTLYKGRFLTDSIADTGSNALFFGDASIPKCSGAAGAGFYCVASPQSLSATIQGVNGANTGVDFSVASADLLLGSGRTAFNDLASPLYFSTGFDWGLPFFFGRKVFLAFENSSVAGAPSGPFLAF